MCFVNAAVHPGDANVALSDAGGLYFEAADGREGVVPQGWLRLCYGEGYWVVPACDARSPTGERVSFPELSAQQRAEHLAALGPKEQWLRNNIHSDMGLGVWRSCSACEALEGVCDPTL